MSAVRCRAALDLGVEAVFTGVAPGYRLVEAAGKTAGAGGAAEKIATGAEAVGAVHRGGRRRGEEEGWVERLLEEVRREFSGLPVYVGVEGGYVYVKRTAPMDQGQFRRYTEACRRLGFRFDRRGERWVKPLEELKTRLFRQSGPVQLTTSASHTYWTSPLSRKTYTASLTAATAIH
jgi:hypothetical protein